MEETYRCTTHGYREWKGVKHPLVDINSDHLEEVLDYIEREKVDMISLSRWYGYKLKDIEIITKIKNLKGIHIYSIQDTDISAIEKCQSLEYVSLLGVNQKLDLSTLPNLCDLSIDWYPCIRLPQTDSGSHLQTLWLSRFRGKTLDSIPEYKNLMDMRFFHGSVTSLSGLERFQNLRNYEHYYGKNLTDISAVVELPQLENLRFYHCRKIQWEGIFEKCPSLQSIVLESCSDIPSLSFLKKIKTLKGFGFGGCNLLDGDLTPLLKLDFFGFDPNKRHYSHTLEELRKIHEDMKTNRNEKHE